MNNTNSMLDRLTPERLRGIRRGLEKESLRAKQDGTLAMTPHPAGLGSALTHPHITTDFCESQVELITGVHSSTAECLEELKQISRFTQREMGDEMLWVSSMPCGLPQDMLIPLGQYGTSNVGRAKTVYRMGLGWRYGRRMQTISGIHYNWSFPDVDNDAYFGLIRNFRRHAFLLLYFFGASPAVCPSFVAGRIHQLQSLSPHTLYLPYATSLRMGRLGYQSDAQSTLAVSYNNLETYAASLEGALTQSYPPYEAMGVKGPDGQYRQLGTTLLQIENEFYGTIRPKRVIRPDERPLHALRERGVEYVEVRLMDLNPFEPLGISAETMRFIDIFLLHCLCSNSPPDTPAETAAMARNQHRVAGSGREPGLMLERGTEEILLTQWVGEILREMQAIAEKLDATFGEKHYQQALESAFRLLKDPYNLPSARVIRSITDEHAGSYTSFVKAHSLHTRELMLKPDLSSGILEKMQLESKESMLKQQQMEASEKVSFDAYLQEYLSPRRLTI